MPPKTAVKPLRPPVGSSSAGASSQRPQSTPGRVQPSQRTAQSRRALGTDSQRGAVPQSSTRKKKELSTAEKLDELDQIRKAKSKAFHASQKKKSRPRVVELPPITTLDELLPPAELLAPMQAIVDKLRAEQAEHQMALLALGPAAEAVAAATTNQPAPASAAGVSSDTAMARAKAVKVWRALADEQLTGMASSLAGALLDANGTKLRALFDKIDLDGSGTIDKHELKAALNESKQHEHTDRQVELLFAATDEDGSGEIDYQEFSDVLKGVRMNNAASVIEKRARERQAKRGSKPPVNTGKRAGASSGDDDLHQIKTVEEFRRELGRVLLSKKANAKELCEMWDRSRDGVLSKMEFRVGVRSSLGLHVHMEAVDKLFAQFDEDGGGELDLAELRDALEYLKDNAAKDGLLREQLSRTIESYPGRIGVLEGFMSKASAAAQAAHDAVGLHAVHRAKPWVDAKIGTELGLKLRSEENESGLELDVLTKRWEEGCKKPGMMDCEEFLRLMAKEFTPFERPGAGGRGGGALGTIAESKDKELEEQEDALKSLGISPPLAKELFGAWDADAQASKAAGAAEPAKGWVYVGLALKQLLQAEVDRKAMEARLAADCVAAKQAALDEQAALQAKCESLLKTNAPASAEEAELKSDANSPATAATAPAPAPAVEAS